MIQSKIKLKYDARDVSKEAKVFVEITECLRLPKENRYQLTVVDCKLSTIVIDKPIYDNNNNITGTTPEEIEVKEVINTKIVSYSYAEIDNLINYCESNFVITEVGCAKRDKLTQLGLLVSTMQAPIYDSLPTDWELTEM